MYSRIHIMGASGAGTSTLGRALADHLPHVHLDSDDYFWERKYTKQTEITERLGRITGDLDQRERWILSGAVCGWGDGLRPRFDLVVFLWIPQDIRLERLRTREYERYGVESLPGGSMFEGVQAFMEWAALYDTAGREVRSRILHEEWMSCLSCPVLRLEGDLSVEERTKVVLKEMSVSF
ncbi:AAA family ATPase [Paenibacillus sp. S150]|uniref:AAA family ATPase n=1 Tax=Paenibacillus sp. S150 TaxID=2749826 RepID=UPI001C56F4EA|nr:AAA family ATPase [Paenibacillus sp. S150]MBW4083103.1 AAA family ATPase [Paenibacillus sp. S150]